MANGIDSRIALALMVKAKRVFEQPGEGTFLSFPLTPCAYTRQQLNLIAGDYQSTEGMRYLCEFSRLVSRIPEGALWPAGETGNLWEIYEDLVGAEDITVAQSTRTAEEEARYQSARRFLHQETADGLLEDTPAMTAYKRYRDVYFLADQACRAALGTPEEARLREARAVAENQWLCDGYRTEVEQAMQTIVSLSGKSGLQSLHEWQERFNKDVDYQVDPTTNQSFAPSFFSPSNALNDGWQKFPLSGAEADSLLDGAPNELRSRLASDSVDLDIESLSFEFSSAGVFRPWLATEVFQSRVWRFNDPSKLLCDGGDPPRGICTAYVAGLIFARNLQVIPKPDSPRNEAALARLAGGASLSLGSFCVAAAERRKPAGVDLTPNKPRLLTMATGAAARPPSGLGPLRPAAPALNAPSRLGGEVRGPVTLTARASAPATRAIPRPAALNPNMLRVLTASPLAREKAPAAPTASVPPAPPALATRNDDDIVILAFICKRLRRCPNPDPNLQW